VLEGIPEGSGKMRFGAMRQGQTGMKRGAQARPHRHLARG